MEEINKMGFITEEQIEEIIEGLEKIEEKYSLGIDIEEIENLLIENPYPDTLNEICEKICEDNVNNEEIIYYSNAMKFLSENDPSLTDSLSIANEYGYNLEDLNSEILATLLHQHIIKSELITVLNI